MEDHKIWRRGGKHFANIIFTLFIFFEFMMGKN